MLRFYLKVTSQEWEQDVALGPLLGEQNSPSSLWYYLYVKVILPYRSKVGLNFCQKPSVWIASIAIYYSVPTFFHDKVFLFDNMHSLLLFCTRAHALMSGQENDIVMRLFKEIFNPVLIGYTKF